jgi:hypothetical protein
MVDKTNKHALLHVLDLLTTLRLISILPVKILDISELILSDFEMSLTILTMMSMGSWKS